MPRHTGCTPPAAACTPPSSFPTTPSSRSSTAYSSLAPAPAQQSFYLLHTGMYIVPYSHGEEGFLGKNIKFWRKEKEYQGCGEEHSVGYRGQRRQYTLLFNTTVVGKNIKWVKWGRGPEMFVKKVNQMGVGYNFKLKGTIYTPVSSSSTFWVSSSIRSSDFLTESSMAWAFRVSSSWTRTSFSTHCSWKIMTNCYFNKKYTFKKLKINSLLNGLINLLQAMIC